MVEHHWNEGRCRECEADGSWCDNPPLPPLGLVPRFIVAENRLVKIDEALHRYFSDQLPIPVEWIEERNELIEYLRNRSI